MIIFQHDHIIQTKTVIDAASDPHGFFFQQPEIRCGFAGIQ